MLARAGRTTSDGSTAVSVSNSWAVTWALPRSPWTAGSRVTGSPPRIVTELRSTAAGLTAPALGPLGRRPTDQPQQGNDEQDGDESGNKAPPTRDRGNLDGIGDRKHASASVPGSPYDGSGTMTLHLRNTLTRRIEPIEPGPEGRFGMYTCGPTVYRWAHVGNLRTYLLADLIRRTLLYHGLDVLHVKNITDVGPPAR